MPLRLCLYFGNPRRTSCMVAGRDYYESPTGLPPYADKLSFELDDGHGCTQNDGALAAYAMPEEETNTYSEKWPYFFDRAGAPLFSENR